MIFVHLKPPAFVIFAKVGHLVEARWAHHPLCNRTEAIHKRPCRPRSIQVNLGTAASHVPKSKTATARYTSRQTECRSSSEPQHCNNANQHRRQRMRMLKRNC
jgi:hypothetical protein